MAVTPTGLLNTPLVNLRTFFSNSVTFQTLTGAANATAALAFISLYDDDEIASNGTFIVLDHAGGWGMGRSQLDNSWQARKGDLWADINIEIPSQYLYERVDAFVYATNQIGAILSEVQTYCATRLTTIVHGWTIAYGPVRSEKSERHTADYVSALVQLEVS